MCRITWKISLWVFFKGRGHCEVSNCEFRNFVLGAFCSLIRILERPKGKSSGEVIFKYCLPFEILVYFSHLLYTKNQ